MAIPQEVQDVIDRMNRRTNELAAQVADLRARVAPVIDGGMSKADEDAVLAQFQEIEAQLAAIGADPADPVPAVA